MPDDEPRPGQRRGGRGDHDAGARPPRAAASARARWPGSRAAANRRGSAGHWWSAGDRDRDRPATRPSAPGAAQVACRTPARGAGFSCARSRPPSSSIAACHQGVGGRVVRHRPGDPRARPSRREPEVDDPSPAGTRSAAARSTGAGAAPPCSAGGTARQSSTAWPRPTAVHVTTVSVATTSRLRRQPRDQGLADQATESARGPSRAPSDPSATGQDNRGRARRAPAARRRPAPGSARRAPSTRTVSTRGAPHRRRGRGPSRHRGLLVSDVMSAPTRRRRPSRRVVACRSSRRCAPGSGRARRACCWRSACGRRARQGSRTGRGSPG